MQPSGRIRKSIGNGWTRLIDGELKNLQVSVLTLEAEETYSLQTAEREWAFVLIQGECNVHLDSGLTTLLGPRDNPFTELPFALFVSKGETMTFVARKKSVFGVGSAPAERKTSNTFVTPDKVDKAIRGAGNWAREMRKVCWSDNTEGNMLLVAETCSFSGNWSTMPPHRHQQAIPGVEAAYEEAYFFQFSHPHGFGLIWQFDDESGMDQAFSLKANDLVYVGHGYHPVVCAPGTTLYHLTLMAGPQRISLASVHPDYQYLLDEKGLANQFTPR